MGGERAFTLIELLVAIGIIAVLIAIMLPAVGMARDSARDVQCRSQLREVFHAQAMYASEHGRYAAVWSAQKPIGWRQRLGPYLGHDSAASGDGPHELFRCPGALPTDYEAQPVGPEQAALLSSVALNGAMQFPEWNFHPSAPPRPDFIIAFGDQPIDILETAVTSDGYGVWSTGHAANWWYAPFHDPDRGYRHRGEVSANFAFADGHVAPLTHDRLVRESGHWYWWDALAGDTAGGPDNFGDPFANNDGPSPSPSPNVDPDDPDAPVGVPCGCFPSPW